MLSGIIPFVFSAGAPPTFPNGLLNEEKIAATSPTMTVDTPTETAAFVGLGTQTCCRRSDALAVGPGDAEEDAVGDEEVAGLEEAEVDGLGDGDVTEESGITEMLFAPSLVTYILPLPGS